MRPAISALLLATVAAAQQVGQNTPPGNSPTATFVGGTQLVVETVVVADKKGNPVRGLTPKDFTVTEDGVPQTLRVFEQQTLAEPSAAPSPPERTRIYEKLGRTQLSPEVPGDSRYKDRRLLALYFDMTAMPQADQLRALDAAQRFIRTGMASADRMAILRYASGAVDVLQIGRAHV